MLFFSGHKPRGLRFKAWLFLTVNFRSLVPQKTIREWVLCVGKPYKMKAIKDLEDLSMRMEKSIRASGNPWIPFKEYITRDAEMSTYRTANGQHYGWNNIVIRQLAWRHGDHIQRKRVRYLTPAWKLRISWGERDPYEIIPGETEREMAEEKRLEDADEATNALIEEEGNAACMTMLRKVVDGLGNEYGEIMLQEMFGNIYNDMRETMPTWRETVEKERLMESEYWGKRMPPRIWNTFEDGGLVLRNNVKELLREYLQDLDTIRTFTDDKEHEYATRRNLYMSIMFMERNPSFLPYYMEINEEIYMKEHKLATTMREAYEDYT